LVNLRAAVLQTVHANARGGFRTADADQCVAV